MHAREVPFRRSNTRLDLLLSLSGLSGSASSMLASDMVRFGIVPFPRSVACSEVLLPILNFSHPRLVLISQSTT